MSMMYVVLAPLFGKVFYDRVRMINHAIKLKDTDGIRVNVFFLALILVVAAGVIFLIQRDQ